MATIPDRQVDFAKLKERVTILQIVDHYGWREALKRSGESYVGRCPLCRTGKRSFSITPPRAWKCLGDCDAGGNHLDLVVRAEGVSIKEAAVIIADWFNIDDCDREPRRANGASREARRGEPRQSKRSRTREAATEGSSRRKRNSEPRQPPVQRNKPLGWKKPLQGLDPQHEWFDELQLLPDTLEEFGIGVCSSGMMSGTAAIPIHNAEGELLAYAGRDIESESRVYKYPDNFRKELEQGSGPVLMFFGRALPRARLVRSATTARAGGHIAVAAKPAAPPA